MLQRQSRVSGANIPNLDCIVARCRCKDILRSGVEEDLPDLSRMARQLADWSDVFWLFRVGVEGEALWNLPDEDLSVV